MTTDDLDFRHHNYKDMRQVGCLSSGWGPVQGLGLGCFPTEQTGLWERRGHWGWVGGRGGGLCNALSFLAPS